MALLGDDSAKKSKGLKVLQGQSPLFPEEARLGQEISIQLGQCGGSWDRTLTCSPIQAIVWHLSTTRVSNRCIKIFSVQFSQRQVFRMAVVLELILYICYQCKTTKMLGLLSKHVKSFNFKLYLRLYSN